MSQELQSTVSDDEVATLLIPILQHQLVLPNVTVAEIIPSIDTTPIDDSPAWLLGHFSWRNTDVPLVSFETFNGQTEQPPVGARIAVLNGLVDSTRLPFCGIVATTVPRQMRVRPNEIANDEGQTPGPAEVTRVLVSGEKAIIPDIDAIQKAVLDVI